MNDLLGRIKRGEEIYDILYQNEKRLFENGSADLSCLEVLSYIKLFHPDLFKEHENSIGGLRRQPYRYRFMRQARDDSLAGLHHRREAL